jgi:hypothetical protein
VFEWQPATEYPESYVWVLGYRSPAPPAVVYISYIIAYHVGDRWISAAGSVVTDITYWTYLSSPADLFTAKLTPLQPADRTLDPLTLDSTGEKDHDPV